MTIRRSARLRRPRYVVGQWHLKFIEQLVQTLRAKRHFAHDVAIRFAIRPATEPVAEFKQCCFLGGKGFGQRRSKVVIAQFQTQADNFFVSFVVGNCRPV